MPSTELLFGDFDMENEDFDDDVESGASDDGNLGNGSLNRSRGEDEGVCVSNGEGKGKKRKGMNKRNEERRNKRLKKLGPKQLKGSRKAETLTKEEVKELSEKEYTQYSNLYNVQLEEVLEECAVSEGTQEKVREWVQEFTEFIQMQEESEKFTVEEFPKFFDGAQMPLPKNLWWVPKNNDAEEGEVRQWMKEKMITWKPPASVEVRGSWAYGTQVEKLSAVDVFVEMPEKYLHKSDYLNHKYHVKRAIYLGILASLIKDKYNIELKFSLANGDPLKPVLNFEVDDVTVIIRAVPPESFFTSSKLACDKNNLRYTHFFEREKLQDEPDTSTQHYNFTILEDSMSVEINQSMQLFLSCYPKFRDTVKLIKIWLAQRGLSEGYGGFSGFLAAQFIHYLSHMNRIKDTMSPLQLLRLYFVNLIQEDLTEKGIGFCDDSDSIKFAQLQWDVVFLDSTGIVNFTANMSKLTYQRIQEEARQALTIIDKRNITGFLALFTIKVKFLMNFDHVFRFAARRLEKSFHGKPEHESSLLDHSGFIYPIAASSLGSLIKKCLGQRITMLDCQLPQSICWPITNPMPSYIPAYIHFGVNINREAAQKLIEKCEGDTQTDIELFKKFWGDQSELRRFKDGTLKECVSLENISHLGKSRLCYQMLHYIIQRHLTYTMGENAYLDKQVEDMITCQYIKVKPAVYMQKIGPKGTKGKPGNIIYLKCKLAKKKMKKLALVTPEEREPVSVDDITKSVSNSFDELSKILRQLEELPLQIATVQGTSAVLRFSHIQPTPPQLYYATKVVTEQHPTRKALLLKRSVVDFRNESAENGAGADDEIQADDGNQLVQEIAISPSQSLLPTKLPKYVEPVGVIIHLETSGQWPDNIKAIERLKCAFLIKIGGLLQAKFGLSVQPYSKHLDVLKDGFIFRIKITYHRELTLLRQLRGADGVLRTRENQESLRMERETLILPQLTSTLHSFHLQYEAFGKTCRLAKRWVASQLLLASPWEYNRNLEEPDCRMTEECVELLVAYLFLNYAPHLSFPSEAQVGFQRFLYFMAKTDFQAFPIIINFNDKWSVDEVAAIELEFVKMRPTLPCLYIATPFDPKGSVWTKNLQTVLMRRLKRLAEVGLAVMESQFDSERVVQNYSELKVIFTPITRDLDVLIRLKSKMNPRSPQSIDNVEKPMMFKSFKRKTEEVIPVTDFDPVQMYLGELRDAFGHLAVFLHDTYGGNVIAVKWKPDVFEPTAFTTSAVKGRYVFKDASNLLSTNINGVLEAFEVMGHGLVEDIETFPDRWEMGN